MVIFHSYVTNYQRVNPMKSHETTIFLWFSYGFPTMDIAFITPSCPGEASHATARARAGDAAAAARVDAE